MISWQVGVQLWKPCLGLAHETLMNVLRDVVAVQNLNLKASFRFRVAAVEVSSGNLDWV